MKLVSLDKSWFVLRCFSGKEREAADDLRQLGFEAYCPTKRVETVHHRTKAIITKEHALLVGYMFAAQPRNDGVMDFPAMKGPKGVIDILRITKDADYLPIPSKLVEGYQIAEMNLAFDDTRAARIARKEEAENKRENARLKFPEGSTVIIDGGIYDRLPGVVRRHLKSGRVKIDVEAFGGVFTVDSDTDKLRSAA